jgi:hypothetical protein
MANVQNNFQLLKFGTGTSGRKKEDTAQTSPATNEVSEQEKEEISRIVQRSADTKEPEKWLAVRKTHLINKLNYTNFQDGTIFIKMTHAKDDRTLILFAKPQPCADDQLDCLWMESGGIDQKLKSYKFDSFFITDGNKLLMVEPELIDISDCGISLKLPDTCYEVSSRATIRHSCQGITVQLIQNSSLFSGILLDFNAVSFRIELKAAPHQTFQWINPESIADIIISDGPEILYSGESKIIRQTWGQKTRKYVLEPVKQEIQRFKHKEFRSNRQELNPSPDIHFKHPFTKKMVFLKVVDLSGSGFSVEEDEKVALLLPGMIVPELELFFADSYTSKCKAQVVYRKICDDEDKGVWVKCGLAILDMSVDDNVRLLSLLHQAHDKRFYLCSTVDLDELWYFFFETGFIYPEKYALLVANKDHIKETCQKLYTQSPNIARHFIYKETGRILGHIAMVRFYENTWLIQHHAARKSALNRAGLAVLNQIGRFINDSHRLNLLHMDYVFCYFRPENKFPNRIFGGVARNINEPKGCSIDAFAYFQFPETYFNESDLPSPWRLEKTQPDDLMDLESFYEYVSGGLLLNALDLEPDLVERDELKKEYQKIGLKREKYLFSLKKDGLLKAVIMVNISDIGLNLSNLTNSVKVIILDSDDLPQNILFQTLSLLSEKMKLPGLTVLLYPVAYARNQYIPYKTVYNLWVMSTQYSDRYFRYLARLLQLI